MELNAPVNESALVSVWKVSITELGEDDFREVRILERDSGFLAKRATARFP